MIENNPLAVASDLSIDSQFWEWAKISKPKKIVSFSSSAAYPIDLQKENDYVLLKENDINFDKNIGMPDMSYGWAKLTHEYLGRLAHERHGMNVVVYRPFSGYGIDQDDTYPFPSICKRVLENQGKEVINVWGTGRQLRDFIHIDDCVYGVVNTMDKITNGDAINLSTGKYTSFIEFVKIAANSIGYDPEVEGLSKKPSGVFARGGDVKKQKELGFDNKINFNVGIKKAMKWYADNQ